MWTLFVRTTVQVRWQLAVLLAGLAIGSGCGLDPVHWRVRDPGMVELTRTVGLEKPPGPPVLASEQGATTVYVPYSYWLRGRALPASACEEGPTPSSRAISELTGLAFGCQGTAVAQRHPDGTLDLDSSRGFERLVGVDGIVLPKLWQHDCDVQSGQCWARLQVRSDAKSDLFLLLATPRNNLSQVLRIQRRSPLLGGLLVGMGVLWAGVSAGVIAIKAKEPALPTGVFAGLAVFSLTLSGSLLGTGIWALTRPEREVPIPLPP
jgi:hypothetical protein